MVKRKIIKKLHSILDYIDNPLLVKARIQKIKGNLPMIFIRNLLEIKRFLPRVDNIFDIGAADGNFVLDAHFVFPEANIFAFEPLPNKVEVLQRIFNERKIPGKVYALGLSSDQGEDWFFQLEYENLSSFLQPDKDLVYLFADRSFYKKIKVKKERFDNIFKLESSNINFAKIDVQGYELEVLKGMGGELSKIQAVMLEVNFDKFYVEQTNYIEIIQYLYNYGFKRFYQLDKIIVNGKVSWCDLIFFK